MENAGGRRGEEGGGGRRRRKGADGRRGTAFAGASATEGAPARLHPSLDSVGRGPFYGNEEGERRSCEMAVFDLDADGIV